MKQRRTPGLSSICTNQSFQIRNQARTTTFNSRGMTHGGGAISTEAISSRDGAAALWRKRTMALSMVQKERKFSETAPPLDVQQKESGAPRLEAELAARAQERLSVEEWVPLRTRRADELPTATTW